MCGDPASRATLAAPQRTLEATRASPKEKEREAEEEDAAAQQTTQQTKYQFSPFSCKSNSAPK